ncbi:hypothetical protein EJB05_26391, partial [Eragrostis curvula]
MSPSPSLIVPPLRGACLCAFHALTSSSVRARLQPIGGHLFRIRGYSLVDRMFVAGQAVWSGEFAAGGHEWRLCYLPKGLMERGDPVVSAFISLVNHTEDTSAAYRVSILDRFGSPAYSSAVGPRLFKYLRSEGKEPGMAELVSAEELKRAADRLVDDEDCLHIRCDVNVLSIDKEADEHRSADGCTEGTAANYSKSEYTIQ